jgi:hypothetical protein
VLAESEAGLLRIAAALEGGGDPAETIEARRAIGAGGDPLGDCLCQLRSAAERRPRGAVYTPAPIVDAMVRWARRRLPEPAEVVDAGAGSGRFLVATGRAFPRSRLLAIELDPVAAALARGHLAAAGLAARAEVRATDYRALELPPIPGPRLFIGNPPYVRHHDIEPPWKAWLSERARALGLAASGLAGLHIHFLLATAALARPGDAAAFVTSAEWLDVNYGELARQLFLGPLGGESLHLVEPGAAPFPDAQATAVIATFLAGSAAPTIRIKRVATVASLGALDGGRRVRRERIAAARRWTPLSFAPRKRPAGFVELGELCRVHRGQVTGNNRFWIASGEDRGLPAPALVPAVTRARELFAAGARLEDIAHLRRVIDLPVDLSAFTGSERRAVDQLLARARRAGVDRGYIARHRRAWWSVGLHEPAPILATYMARRPPAFVRNHGGARHLNIAHGLYPREPLAEDALAALVAYLARAVTTREGRTYAGGLTKFEPREMERLLVPAPARLAAAISAAAGP